jgi:hypothetical protein
VRMMHERGGRCVLSCGSWGVVWRRRRMRPHAAVRHRPEVKRSFERFASSGSGELTLQEFNRALQSLRMEPMANETVAKVFADIDRDANAGVSWPEFCLAVTRYQLPVRRTHVSLSPQPTRAVWLAGGAQWAQWAQCSTPILITLQFEERARHGCGRPDRSDGASAPLSASGAHTLLLLLSRRRCMSPQEAPAVLAKLPPGPPAQHRSTAVQHRYACVPA